MSLNNKHLIVGADSQLGTGIKHRLEGSGRHCLCTSRRPDIVASDLFFDLSSGYNNWTIPDNITCAYFCTAVTAVSDCREHSAKTHQLNVVNSLEFIKRLQERNIFIVFPSTNLVFDGCEPFQAVDARYSPKVEYGRQKVEVEMELVKFIKHVAIIRFTKILTPHNPLFSSWVNRLKNGLIIRPFSDMVFSPIPLNVASDMAAQIAMKKSNGIWQLSGEKDVSYEDFARLIAEMLGVSQDLICPVRAESTGIYFEHIPANTTLDMRRAQDELDIVVPNIQDSIDYLLNEMESHVVYR